MMKQSRPTKMSRLATNRAANSRPSDEARRACHRCKMIFSPFIRAARAVMMPAA